VPETHVLSVESVVSISEAASLLLSGEVIAFPTDTVYGLGAHSQRLEGIQRLYELKGRSRHKAIALLLGSVCELATVATDIPEIAWRLAERFWPGPLTLVLPKARQLLDAVTAGGPTVAVRVPNRPWVLELISTVGAALAATSANLSGRTEAVTAEGVLEVFAGQIPMLLDGGRCPGGVPSTVVDVTVSPVLIRRQGAQLAEVESFLKELV